jgi:hypothetical protein
MRVKRIHARELLHYLYSINIPELAIIIWNKHAAHMKKKFT